MLNQARADARERPRIRLDIGRGHGACDRHREPVQRAKEFGEVPCQGQWWRAVGDQGPQVAAVDGGLTSNAWEFFGTACRPGNYVFTFEDGRPAHPDSIRQRFDRLAAAAGLERITFHDLRHSYATAPLKPGASPKIVSERIGHADVGFFLQIYAHVLKNDDREAAEQAAAFLIGDGYGPIGSD